MFIYFYILKQHVYISLFTSYFIAVAEIRSGWSYVGPEFPQKCKLQIYVFFFHRFGCGFLSTTCFSSPCTFFRFSVFLWKTNEKHILQFSHIWISRITVTSPITTVLCGPLLEKTCHNYNARKHCLSETDMAVVRCMMG